MIIKINQLNNYMIFKIIISCVILGIGLSYITYDIINKSKHHKTIYLDLKHCKVPKEWEEIRDRAWNKASTLLSAQGIKPITKCKKITIESGIKFNPNTKQWGRSTKNGFWYAGLNNTKEVIVVGTPDKKPYERSLAILAHEVGESILDQDPHWATRSVNDRNKFLWYIGL